MEKFANNIATTLNGGINDSTTTAVITSATGFPASGNFRILIDDEILLVTARSSATLTVTRGAESTTAASHADLAPVTMVLTKAGLESIKEAPFIVPISGTPTAIQLGDDGYTRGQYAADLCAYRGTSTDVASGNYSALLGGLNNSATSAASAVVGGDTNRIGSSSSYSTIVGGVSNVLTSAPNCGSFASTSCTLEDSTTAAFIAAASSQIGDVDQGGTGCDYSMVAASSGSNVYPLSSSDADYSAAIASASCTIYGSSNALVTGYINQIGTSSTKADLCVAHGIYGLATDTNSYVHSSGTFGFTLGEAQYVRSVAKGESDGTSTRVQLAIDGIGGYITLKSNRAATWVATAVFLSPTGLTGHYVVHGGAYNDGTGNVITYSTNALAYADMGFTTNLEIEAPAYDDKYTIMATAYDSSALPCRVVCTFEQTQVLLQETGSSS